MIREFIEKVDKIEKVRGKTEKESFDAKKTLEDGTSNDRLSKIFKAARAKTGRKESQKVSKT